MKYYKSFMTKKQEEIKNAKINEALNLLRIGSRKVNEIRYSTSESVEHRTTKKNICKSLWLKGKDFVTEAIFKNGCRADIFVLEDFKVIEIMKTETIESIEKKMKKYPKGLKFKPIKC